MKAKASSSIAELPVHIRYKKYVYVMYANLVRSKVPHIHTLCNIYTQFCNIVIEEEIGSNFRESSFYVVPEQSQSSESQVLYGRFNNKLWIVA